LGKQVAPVRIRFVATNIEEHLSQISTHWSLVFRAHHEDETARKEAQELLLERYLRPTYFYILSAVRDEHAASDLCQQFALRFVRGDFHQANPERGRFRHFVKAALRNLIIDHQRQRTRQPAPLPDVLLEELASREPEPAQAFDEACRADLIDRAWKRLAEFESQQKGSHLYTVFRYGAEHRDQSANEIAAALERQLQSPFTAENVWQTQRRAKKKFAAFLVEEVAGLLRNPSTDELREELTELGLIAFCKPALAQRSP
jgi:RNA polymerase sigma-70 factor (ECF subfamily)